MGLILRVMTPTLVFLSSLLSYSILHVNIENLCHSFLR